MLFLLFPLVLTFGFALFLRARKARKREKRARVNEELSLWAGIAASLFDSSEAPASARMEIALLAVARRLKVGAGLVTEQEGSGRIVLASAASDTRILAGLGRGSVVPQASVYCGSVRENTPPLAINYASSSEWRNHPACRDLAWETYLGIHCEASARKNLVVAFFDSVPREHPFTQAEKNLLEQVGPWIAAMADQVDFPDAPIDGIVYPISENRKSGEA
jgi:hypothetical protein